MTKRERTPDIDVEEIIEMFRPEMGRLKTTDVGLENVLSTTSVPGEPNVQTVTTHSTDSSPTTDQPADISNRVGMKEKRAAFEEYRRTFLQVPKIENRKPVFVSCEIRDRLDEIVRRLGGRRMSVSGLIENLARHHLTTYEEDIEQWRKL